MNKRRTHTKKKTKGVTSAARLKKLETELAMAEAKLRVQFEENQTYAEELQTANEELRASNEELRGSNEDLEVSHSNQKTINLRLAEKIKEVQAGIAIRKEAEENLAFQAHLLANVHDAIIGLDADFVINYWNDSAAAMY